jgi:SPP1 gp7 family putative phage head morphogenesis protein
MSFKASKKREKKAPEPIGRGSPVIANASIAAKYRRNMDSAFAAMIADYREKVKEALAHPVMERFYAEDASPASTMKSVLNSLRQRWSGLFEEFARAFAKDFVNSAEEGATNSTLWSLSTAGLEAPVKTYNQNIANTMEAAVEYNHTLITNLAAEVHDKVHDAVMLSLTSPNPEQQGTSGIMNALKEIGGFSKKRTKLIAVDQTSKLYSAVSDERMLQNGCDEFEWDHSAAGKTPRHSHQLMNGHIFKVNDPRLWQTGGEFELKKGDLGPPGWAIHCRCRKIPVF